MSKETKETKKNNLSFHVETNMNLNENNKKENKYKRVITRRCIDNDFYLDVYDIDAMWPEENTAVVHARKKLINLGKRSGGKSKVQDIEEAIQSLEEALVLELNNDYTRNKR